MSALVCVIVKLRLYIQTTHPTSGRTPFSPILLCLLMPNYINLEPVYLSATKPTTPLPTDTHGFLPYNCQIRATKNTILQYSSLAKGPAIYY